MFKAISELRVRITSSTEIPEPTNIQSTGDWYFIDHISSGLAYYDSTNKTFAPMLALSWSEQADGTHLFKLRDGIRFHDGTPITGKDVLWSIKRHLLKKTSTHFPLWDYLVGCDHLKRLDEECDGLKLRGETEIIFRLKAQTDSFFLQLSSPETGIWSASDMNPETGELSPTKFSGPYFVESRNTESALLRRNENNKLSELFPESPRSIRIVRVPLANLDQAISDHKIDVAIKMHSPLAEPDWQRKNIAVESTTPSQIIYLFGLGAGSKPEIGRNLIEALWQENRDPILSPADSFLPFSPKFGLSRSDFLEALPAKSSAKLRVMYPAGFFSAEFLSQFANSGKKVGCEIVFSPVSGPEFLSAFNDSRASEKFDYVLSAYAASERYPAVQLRYLTKSLAKPPIDLKTAESPDFIGDRSKIFHDYEKWLLSSGTATPLFFNVTLVVHQQNIDMGEQSKSDAEVELWRVRERIR